MKYLHALNNVLKCGIPFFFGELSLAPQPATLEV
jgi:hypothetical protein